MLSRLSRGLSLHSSPDIQQPIKSQSEIDNDIERLMADLRASSKEIKIGEPNAYNHSPLHDIPGTSGSEISLPPEGQSPSPGVLSDNSLMDRYIYQTFSTDEEGRSTKTLDSVFLELKEKIPNIGSQDLERHLDRMKEEGKIDIKVSVIFNKQKISLTENAYS